MPKKISEKFTYLNELNRPLKNGYLIVDDMLFEISNYNIENSWEISGKTIAQKVVSARTEADISNRTRVVVDDEGCYNVDTLLDEGMLITDDEAFNQMCEEDQEDYESLMEYFM